MVTGLVWANRPRTSGMVLDLIRAARSISRIELTGTMGLTPPTISEAVRELIDQGPVVEAHMPPEQALSFVATQATARPRSPAG